MKKAIALGTLLALGLSAAPAYAEGTFTGFYAGAEVAAARSDTKTTVTPVTGAAATRTNKKTQADIGLFGGFGYQFDNGFYLGTEASVNRPTGQNKAVTLAGVSVRERPQYELAIKGVAGIGITDSTLLYASAGIAQNRAKYQLPNNVTRKATSSGRVLGIGVAQAFGDNLIGRVEYENTTYDRKSFATAGAPTVTYKPASNRISVGLAYKF
ncbi:outer membrane protein [Aquidulcibacter paucihalophilus]|uniref:outer membrane protein n=1 Tax=Aquidulcibacter paucihalophilus TaxID=1978549 RepID=UPI000A19471E|nr:outer membrane beta-barrel protein [Aquidulcibacter paucihalophilus]